ncbi:MAG TPA: 5-(carboxyamino)imidazole ribonucleotide mutase [Candidatus Xenobia bacterium]|jgi:5-(carboxyamino)imidazole ribonucleotide mutase
MIGIVMGSASDYDTMRHAEEVLRRFQVPYDIQVVSAHRTPDLLQQYASGARAQGLKFIIAGAGGAAHLPGMMAAFSTVPVLGVPVQSKALQGLDSLLSIVQMPAGVPTATFAIGPAGATNAALFAVQVLALSDEGLRRALDTYRKDLAEQALAGNEQVRAQGSP